MAGFGHKSNPKKNKPQQKNQAGGEDLAKKAVEFHVRGDIANAEKAYRESICRGFSSAAVFTNLGIICQDTLRMDEAIAHYKSNKNKSR